MSTVLQRQDYIDYIKLQVTGGLLELEIDDDVIGKFVDAALIELRRYIDETKLIEAPFAKCIDLNGFNHSAIINVYRTEGFTGDTINNSYCTHIGTKITCITKIRKIPNAIT